ncbi:alpha/beta fold hydrolase [Williamsia soli]|uniref:alpha/beta fold hydrolase n=1 Tax=Williamsia soli TaxID=364929 RepID=UPI001A9F93B2|nr:alpha/beta hydrolase [Williamsia soli]
MSEHLVDIPGGLRVNVQIVGDGDPVLLIHGWSLSSEVWDRQIRVLAESNRRVLAMDMRGHGKSDAPLDGYGIEQLSRDAFAVLDAFDVERADVVGWSLGGMVALRMASMSPDRVSSVVLVASNGVSASRTESFPFGMPADVPLPRIINGEKGDRINSRRSAVADPFKSPPPPEVLDWLHRISLQTPSWAGIAAMQTLLCTDQVHVLNGLATTVSQIIGVADPALSVRGARWLSAEIGSQLTELDCGHYPMLEMADEFDEALLMALGATGPVR